MQSQTLPAARLKIAGAWSGVIDVHLETWTLQMLRSEVAARSVGSPDRIKLISGGRVLIDGPQPQSLLDLGLKNNSKILATVVSPDLGKSLNDEAAAIEQQQHQALIDEAAATEQRKSQAQICKKKAATSMISCATVKDENDNTILHFSTFDSDGSLLNRFSKPVLENKPFVISHCRDLLLLTDNNTFLCNLTTQELITLPNITDREDSYGGSGFGYVPSTEEFKVLANLSYSGLGFKILTLGAHHWRDVEAPPFEVEGYGGAFLNGAIHLRSHRGRRIATFNLEREEWGSIAGPPAWLSSVISSLKELSGYLCMVDKGFSSLNVWLLNDYDNSSWVKLCNIRISVLNANHPFMVTPLALEDDGRLLVQVDEYGLQIYDPETKSAREIYRFEEFGHLRSLYVKVFSSSGDQ